MRSPLPAALLLVAARAFAHDADVVYVELSGGETDAGFVELVTMSAPTLGMLAPVDANSDGELTQEDLDARADALRIGVWDQAKLSPCVRSGETASIEPGYVALRAHFDCGPGELSQEFKWLMVLPPNFRVVLGTQVAGEAAGKGFAQGDMRTLHVPRPGDWKTTKVVSFTLGSVLDLLVVIAAVAALGAWRSRKLRWPLLALAFFAAGFWLVQRLMT